jgi:hypothetical protein
VSGTAIIPRSGERACWRDHSLRLRSARMRSTFLGGFESTTTSEGAPQRSNPRPRIARGVMDGGEITTAKRHPWTDGGPSDHKCNFDTPDISHVHIHIHTSIHPIHPFTWLICTIIQWANHVLYHLDHCIALQYYTELWSAALVGSSVPLDSFALALSSFYFRWLCINIPPHPFSPPRAGKVEDFVFWHVEVR